MPNFVTRLKDISQKAIRTNFDLLEAIAGSVHLFVPEDVLMAEDETPSIPTEFAMDKVYTTLKLFHRDWSREVGPSPPLSAPAPALCCA